MLKTVSKSLFVAALFLAGLLPAEACGRRHGSSSCAPACESSCGSSACGGSACASSACEAAPCAAPAPQYEERKVTRYKAVMSERDVTQAVTKMVQKQENFTYTVMVPHTVAEKRKVTEYNTVQEQQPYTYTVMVPRTVAEKRKVTEYNTVQEQQAYTYTVMVPHTVTENVSHTVMRRVTEQVTESVPVCKIVRTSGDACGGCASSCERVTVMEQRTRCVTKCVPETVTVACNKTVCTAEQRQGTRTVCKTVPVVREITVNRTECVAEQRQGTRTICVPVTENVTHKVQVCTQVPYEETIRVQVCGSSSCGSDSCGSACSSSSETACSTCSSGHSRRHCR